MRLPGKAYLQHDKGIVCHSEEFSAVELAAVRQRDYQRLRVMVGYCKSTACLRGYILDYFGQEHAASCHNCGNCRSEYQDEDITVAAEALFHHQLINMPVRRERRVEASERKRRGQTVAATAETGLFARLRDTRTRIAQAEVVPAYIVFSNATLLGMAKRAPRIMVQFLNLSGVGEVKAARYGEDFLQTIAAYAEEG